MRKQSRREARDRDEVRRRVNAVTATSQRLLERSVQLGPATPPWADEEYRQLAAQARAAERSLFDWLRSLHHGMAAGTADAFDQAFAFLELDVYLFRSGYERAKLVRAMARSPMTPPQRTRARAHVRACVDGQLHCDLRALAMLARVVADNSLRRHLLLGGDAGQALGQLGVVEIDKPDSGQQLQARFNALARGRLRHDGGPLPRRSTGSATSSLPQQARPRRRTTTAEF